MAMKDGGGAGGGRGNLLAFAKALNDPWYIQRSTLELILAIASRERVLEDWDGVQRMPESLRTRTGRDMDGTRHVENRNGVAVVSIIGPIFRYADFFTEISGATSTEHLAKDIQTAIDDPSIKAIILDIDSPGGHAKGIGELANTIFAARNVKPICAYVGAEACSAAYYLAAACGEIVTAPNALLGSIGTVVGVAVLDEKTKAKTVEIVSDQSPNKRPDVTTQKGKAQYQELVNQLTDVFVADVARFRDVSEEDVLADFGRGGLLVGQAAVDVGMTDRLGSLESLIVELDEVQRGGKPVYFRSTPLSDDDDDTEEMHMAKSRTEDPPIPESTWAAFKAFMMGHAAGQTGETTTAAAPAAPNPATPPANYKPPEGFALVPVTALAQTQQHGSKIEPTPTPAQANQDPGLMAAFMQFLATNPVIAHPGQAAPPAAPAGQTADDPNAALVKRLDALEAQNKALLAAQGQGQSTAAGGSLDQMADMFCTQATQAGHLFPASANALKTLYLRAAQLDQLHPNMVDSAGQQLLPTLGLVQLFVESIPNHGLFGERTSAAEANGLSTTTATHGVPANGAVVLPRADTPNPNDPNAPVAPGRVDQLLGLTDIGREALSRRHVQTNGTRR